MKRLERFGVGLMMEWYFEDEERVLERNMVQLRLTSGSKEDGSATILRMTLPDMAQPEQALKRVLFVQPH